VRSEVEEIRGGGKGRREEGKKEAGERERENE
jgi:hypothetical protein